MSLTFKTSNNPVQHIRWGLQHAAFLFLFLAAWILLKQSGTTTATTAPVVIAILIVGGLVNFLYFCGYMLIAGFRFFLGRDQESAIPAAEEYAGQSFEEELQALMKAFHKGHPARPLALVYLLFLCIGYIFYLAAYFMPTPYWGRELVAWATPIVQGLDTAARVAVERQTDPFPAQVVMLYCAVSVLVLTGWTLFHMFGNHRFQEHQFQNLKKYGDGWKARLKLYFLGIGGCSFFRFCCMTCFFSLAGKLGGEPIRFIHLLLVR